MANRIVLATTGLAPKWLAGIDSVNGHYPLGLASLHAVAEKAGHQIETLFLVKEPLERSVELVRAAVKKMDAQVLGLSIITDNRTSSFRTIEALHNEFPAIRIVLGGVHATVMAEQIITQYPFAVVVLGEGELTFLDLLDAFETARDLSEVAGIAYFDGGKVAKTPPRPLIEDLDSLPFPRHDIFYSTDRMAGQLLTSRGCPYACSFCALDSVSRRKVRRHSVKRVVDEIEKILTDHPQTQIITIYDDQFFIDNKRVIEICDEIVRRGIKSSFSCQGRVKPLSREVVLALERANFQHVVLGLESGSPEILERCHKKIQIADVERAVKLFADSDINIQVLLIIGLPGERMATVMETVDVCKRLQNIKYHQYDHKVQDLYVYPGTEIYDIYKAAGKIDDDFWLSDSDCPRFELESDNTGYKILRKMMMDHLNVYRLLTVQGIRAQRDMIPSIIRYMYKPNAFLNLDFLLPVFTAAIERAIVGNRLSFVGETVRPTGDLATFTARRKPGSETELLIGITSFPADIQWPDLVKTAYLQEITPITHVIDRIFGEFLEQAVAENDPVLDSTKAWIQANHWFDLLQ